VLGEQFGVSRIVLRQAVHRLADVQLVRVRQGGATVVLDPADAGDLRLIALYYFLDPGGEAARAIRRDAIEKQFLQGLSLIDVCARRGSREERASLLELTRAFDEKHALEPDFVAFEESFWRAVARAGKNRIFAMEVAWWYGTLAGARPSAAADAPPIAVRIAFYRELARRLVEGTGATQYYLSVTSPQLDALFAKDER
jgi:DNA-binding FadR family transcriptional regulator